MAIKTISQFPSGEPTDNDYILFEQNGEGKSAAIGDAVNTCALSYEEIMASTDLVNRVASASVLKSLSDNLNGFSVLKSNYGTNDIWDIDDLNSYPKGEGILNYELFGSYTTGTKPFTDGHLLTFIWRNQTTGGINIISQIAVEDDSGTIEMRHYKSSWYAWRSISIS